MPEYKIHEQDKFLAKHKARFEKGKKDEDSLKAKKQTMQGILKDLTGMPTKLHAVGPVGQTSVKKSAPRENDKHGGDGKDLMD